jgi:imidazoleglycerol-phosphate dehydratase / histidinol-phosphatase
MKQKVLFIDRDGTIIKEPHGYQIDDFSKLQFLEGAISALKTIASWNEYTLVLVTNQDGLGTATFPMETFVGPHKMMIDVLASEGVYFSEECIDRSFPEDNAPTRKPRTGMLHAYMSDAYDLENSFVIGDRWTDVELAKNLGCKAFLLPSETDLGANELGTQKEVLEKSIQREVDNWNELLVDLRLGVRVITVNRKTAETDCTIRLDLDGTGKINIATGLHFFDHMLEQIARHGHLDLDISMQGDLHIDEHHTVEDTALTLGMALDKALGNKKAIERYGFSLPMDECIATSAIDFGGRPELVFDAYFTREYVGELPTEMVKHFFKSLCFTARCNIYLKVEGENDHHKIESLFKAFAKAILMAKRRSGNLDFLPSTKNEL